MLINAATRERLSTPAAAASPPHRTGVSPSWPRRALDLAASLSALLLLAPVLLLVAIAVRCTSPGSILFQQVRIGQGGVPFIIYKFRSMRAGAGGPEVTAADDLRVTRIGRLLRSTGLDELPQLFNILRGDMTLVGPRPETPALARRYPRVCAVVFDYRPGLTGPSQVRLRDKDVLPSRTLATLDFEELYLSNFVPMRTALDLDYLDNPSLRRTVGYLFETALYLLRPARRALLRATRTLRGLWAPAADAGVAPSYAEIRVLDLRERAPDRNRNW